MRRILSTAIALALTIMMGSFAYAATTGNGDQNVSANVAATLELSVPVDLDLGDLAIGQNESSDQAILVKSNVSYGIQLKGDRANMQDYSSGVYGTITLATAFQWKESLSGAYTDISTVNAAIDSGVAPTPHAGTTTNVKYRQEAKFDDEPAAVGNEYHIIMTFTATQGI